MTLVGREERGSEGDPVRVGLFARFVIGVLFAVVLAIGPAQAQTSGVVREVVVEGTQRIEPETIRSYLLVREGDAFDPDRINRSLKALFATGLFADVAIRREGDALVVNVVENPVINRIAFEGNQRIDDEELEREISLRPRVIYTRSKVQNDVQRILTLYRRSGRFAATVDPKVIRLDQNRIDLVFEISEGERTEVSRIRFVGNHEFSDSRLREVVRTRETHWYTFFSSDDTYDPDRLTLDRELLRRFYLSEGYADFNVVSAVAELTPDRKSFFITFTVEEGPRYEIGDVGIEVGLKGVEKEALQDVVEMESGDWYSSAEVDKTVDNLVNRVGELGQPFVEVKPRVNRDRENKTIDVTFLVNEGPRIFVERIDIVGNVRTEDNVIRREFRLVEGDAFNASRLRRSRQRIQDLDFFEKVELEQVPGSAPDKTVVKVEVEEKSTGSFNIGAGFSSANGGLLDFSIRERNLLGKGQDLTLDAVLAQRLSRVQLSFTEPYFLDREVAAGFDLFHSRVDRQDESSYDITTTGGSLRMNYPLTENLRQGWRYTFKETKVEDVPSDASQFIKNEVGVEYLSEISHVLTYDRRDSRINPTEGYFIRNTTDLAGLGGDSQYLRDTLSGGKYFRLKDQWVLALTGEVGYIVGLGDDPGVRDRFYLGGDDLRGFETAGVGPRDITTDDALGGEWFYSSTAELTFPVGLPNEYGITGHVFTDIGSLGGGISSPIVKDTGSVRISVGVGVGWVSPLGPIGVDLGFPVLKEDFDETELFRINFGTRF